MFTILNLLLIALVALIAYWWANQGLFSAILHLVCVVAAGAVTIAVWEPLNMRLLLRGNAFDNYAWGVSFVLVFVLALFGLRLISDKLIGANVQLPPWANIAFGLPVGAVAGVLTMGLFIIGAGHIQSGREIMGFEGYARSTQNGRVAHTNKLWAPVHEWTYEFYSYLSVGSLYPTFNNTPLRQQNPDLHLQAASLVRDAWVGENGSGKLSLKPSDARIEEFYYSADPQMRKCAIKVFFDSGARDFGEQLTLSASQIRLIGEPATQTAEAPFAFPESWSQYDGWHSFDDRTHYITSEPGQADATVWIIFDLRDLQGNNPKFIQIRGTRYRLPPRREVTPGDFVQVRGPARAAVSHATATIDKAAPTIQQAIQVSNNIRPITASLNNKPSGIEITDKHISGGDGDFLRMGGDRPSRALMIVGILEPTGTRIVQVDVSRESAATVFGNVQERAGENASIMLVDTHGRTYQPIGFIHEKPDNKIRVKVDFQNFSSTLEKLPSLPSAGGQTLRLLFNVTEGVVIEGLKLGEVTVGVCATEVPRAAGSTQQPPPADNAGSGSPAL